MPRMELVPQPISLALSRFRELTGLHWNGDKFVPSKAGQPTIIEQLKSQQELIQDSRQRIQDLEAETVLWGAEVNRLAASKAAHVEHIAHLEKKVKGQAEHINKLQGAVELMKRLEEIAPKLRPLVEILDEIEVDEEGDFFEED